MKYFLDTNICIYYLKGLYPNLLKNLIRYSPSEIEITSMTAAELFFGAAKSANVHANQEKIETFLHPFVIREFGKKEAAFYARIRSATEKNGKVIGPNDLVIAATVLSNHGILVTHNTKEFKQIHGLALADWTE